MQRGHRLVYELEQLRAATQVDLQLDRLTGVFNRQAMLSILFRETDRVQRLQGTLSLVLLDIDDFSHWNLDLGREACNSLLKQVAERTSRVLRSYDIVGRTGSDEFLIALPGCSTVNAVLTAERLRIEVFAEPFTVKIAISGERQIQLSASYGVALSGGRSPVVVLREAEQAVAQARLRGPDTICCACNRAFSSAPQPALPEIEEEMALR
jgi:diguanylate cyclase (GGDEF)-like protein